MTKLVVRTVHRQHQNAKTAGHIIAFVCPRDAGRNTYHLVHGTQALNKAARFSCKASALAALESVPEVDRVSFEILLYEQVQNE
jgi:hypothetical protein